MKSINKFFDYKRLSYAVAAFAVVLTTALPSLAFAAQVTDRSIALSNSSVLATGVSYKVNFKSIGAAGAFVVDFCSNSPAFGQACTAPDGFTAAAADSITSGITDVSLLGASANKIVVTGTVPAATAMSVDITGITNPDDAGPLYARIVTYDTAGHAADYVSSTVTTESVGYVDNGSAAMYITPTIGVSGAVLETLIFCASNHTLTANCGGADAPNVVLAGASGALENVASEGTIHSQISTNAVSGAIVNLKSSTTGCGGLLRAGTGTVTERCGIKPMLTAASTIGDGLSLFGVKLASLVDGTGHVAASGGYSTANFFMNYDDDGTEDTGVTSTYGDPIYNTVDAPISNGGVDLVFGANIGNDTPAGNYSANLSLIATGKF
jgi:hypothetical protein